MPIVPGVTFRNLAMRFKFSTLFFAILFQFYAILSEDRGPAALLWQYLFEYYSST